MATQIITPACAKQGTAKGRKATNRTEGPQSVTGSAWRSLSTSARDAACALMQAAEDRSEQDMNVECFLRLMSMAGSTLGQFAFNCEMHSQEESEKTVFDSMALIKGALHVPEEPDDIARSLATQAYNILDKLVWTMTDGPDHAKGAPAVRAAIDAVTADAPGEDGDSALVDFDRRILIRDSICEVLDWNDMMRREQGDDRFERLVPIMLQRINVLSSCILDAIDDATISTELIQDRIDGKAVH